MVYKKYIKRGEKVFGPYYYKSRKVNGKVITDYLGTSFGKEKKFQKRFLWFGVFGLVVVLFLFFIINLNLTGKISSDIKTKYNEGEMLKGTLKFKLNKGELLPVDSKIIVSLGNNVQEHFLSGLVDAETTSGDFYIEDIGSLGEGIGYGVIGTKKIYPDVSFELEILDEVEESEIVSGTVSKRNKFNYEYEEGKTVQLVEGSVTANGETISDGDVTIKPKKKKVVVSTKYYIEEQGFGEDYLGKKGLSLKIKLEEFDLSVEEDSELYVFLVYNSTEIVSVSETIDVINETVGEEPPLPPNETKEENITEISPTLPPVGTQNETKKNETITNKTIEIPEQITNETIVNETALSVTNVSTIQYGAVLNMPVKWKKTIKPVNVIEVRVQVPKEAENITVYKILESQSEDIQFSSFDNMQREFQSLLSENSADEKNKLDAEFNEEQKVQITAEVISAEVVHGEISAEINIKEGSSILMFFKNLFNVFTGRAIDVEESEEIKEVIITENATEFEIEYETPGAVSAETDIDFGTEVFISSDVDYENILAYSELPYSVPKSEIKLYEVVDGSRELINFIGYSADEKIIAQASFDNLTSSEIKEDIINRVAGEGVSAYTNITYIEWIVPHLSNRTYEIDFVVLDAESEEGGDSGSSTGSSTGSVTDSDSSYNEITEMPDLENGVVITDNASLTLNNDSNIFETAVLLKSRLFIFWSGITIAFILLLILLKRKFL